jgi:hypothetical protein
MEPRGEVLNLSIKLASFRFFFANSERHGREFEASDSSIGTTDGASHRNRIESLGQAR